MSGEKARANSEHFKGSILGTQEHLKSFPALSTIETSSWIPNTENSCHRAGPRTHLRSGLSHQILSNELRHQIKGDEKCSWCSSFKLKFLGANAHEKPRPGPHPFRAFIFLKNTASSQGVLPVRNRSCTASSLIRWTSSLLVISFQTTCITSTA